MKLKSLLLLIGTISGVAYANIPGTAPYQNIVTIDRYHSTLVTVDSKGVAYISHDGQTWNNLFAFNSTKSSPYYAYGDNLGNAYFTDRKGDELWKYSDQTGSASPDGNIFPSFNRGRHIDIIGVSNDTNHTQYAFTTKGYSGFFSPEIYSRSNVQNSWIQLSTGPSSYSANFISIGSKIGDYMVLNKNNSMLYDVSGMVNYQPLPCNNVNPSFLGVVPAVEDGFTDSYFLMCGMGNKARLYWNDDPRSGNGWSSIGNLFAPSAEDSSSYSYVMAKSPTYLQGKIRLAGNQTVFKNPTFFMIVENHKSGPDYGRLCLRSNRTTNNEIECGHPFSIPQEDEQVYAGSIFQNDNTGELRAVFVGSRSFALNILINMVNKDGVNVIYAASPVWN